MHTIRNHSKAPVGIPGVGSIPSGGEAKVNDQQLAGIEANRICQRWLKSGAISVERKEQSRRDDDAKAEEVPPEATEPPPPPPPPPRNKAQDEPGSDSKSSGGKKSGD